MFDKNKFAQILKNINETYSSQRDFSKKSAINRTYLSQYMNAKLDEPPKPKILKKLADNSNGITSYENLMVICGYINNTNSHNTNNELISLYEKLNNIEKTYENRKRKLTPEENQVVHDLSKQLLKCLHEYGQTPETFDPNAILQDIKFLPNKSKNKISQVLREDFQYFYNKNTIRKQISDLKLKDNKSSDSFINNHVEKIYPNISFYMCPVYSQISAIQQNWEEKNIEGRIPINTNLMHITNPEEYFFVHANDESMNKVIKNGAFALIHKQDNIENGEIALVLVNNFDVTIKKFTKQGDLIILEPLSNKKDFETQVYDKTTPIRILGKYVGKIEMNK